ncbi:MAG: proline--tRNA ligase [Actinomycetaceae bacterium]|nr:proline--tRNA ligase [Actinomycetaceae bacterium]
MLATMSSYFIRTLREDPADAEVQSHKLLLRGGYIRRAAPGGYTWLPLGLRVLRNVERIVREEMDRVGAQEVLFPALLPKEPYEATDRWEEYGPNLFRLVDRKGADMLLAPTHEEMFTLLVKDLYSSYKDLPVTLYQIQTKYRDEARPRAGLIRGREFVMKDAYSFDVSDEGLAASYEQMRVAYQRIFERLGLPYVICQATSGAMGGSRSEEFLFPCEIGEDTFVRTDGGYAANVEAVRTVRPDPVVGNHPPATDIETPGASTIATVVDYFNTHHPRADRPWDASDTLKSVVIAATHPDGTRETIVVGIAGDRGVDMKRLEAEFAPAEIEMATAADISKFDALVPGFLGPAVCGPNYVDNAGNRLGPRFFVDAHVADNSVWITGGNRSGYHTYNLVYGRDFAADGIVEASEIREGEAAPDGSGPLRLARGIEIGHIFQLGRKYAKALGLTVLDENGKTQVVTMGSYGIGVSRVMAALAEQDCDELGLKWSKEIAPFQVHVLATGKKPEIFAAASQLAGLLDGRGIDVLCDDRPKMSAGVKFKDAELLGMPYIVVLGRDFEKEGTVEIRDRRAGTRQSVEFAQAADVLEGLVK